MKPMIFKDKNCVICNNVYTPTGRCSKYCPDCKDEQWRIVQNKAKHRCDVRKGKIKNPGVGSGGAQPKGKESPYYKTGIGCDFSAIRAKIKQERRYCEHCGKDLIDATHYQWCSHHIDHDRINNDESNVALLCKRCHQIEHECHKAFVKCND